MGAMSNKLIYITNTRLPSEKANSYQSMQMCNSFAKLYDEVELWVPKLNNSEEMNEIKNEYEFYSIPKSFKINSYFTIDSIIVSKLNQFIWANIKSATFGINMLFQVYKLKNPTIVVFTRDWYALKFLLLGKKIGIIKNSVFYEAHKFSARLVNNFKQCDGLVVINDCLKGLYQEKRVDNIFVAHDGVNLDTFKSIDKDKALAILGLDKKFTYVIYVGRFDTLEEEKGIPQIVESLQYTDNNIKAIFLGGPLDNVHFYYEIAKKYNIDKNKLIFIDRQPVCELYKYISASSILLMPFPFTNHYAYYMSPLKMFEYMASKRPVIASNLPSICEVLQDKKNAILCEPNNSKDLSDKINWVLENNCKNIVNQAFADVQEYTWDKRAANIKEFMEKGINV